MTAPILMMHNRIHVIRDDLFPGGTKARFLPALMAGDIDEVVYASPCEGGAQTAIATAAAAMGKRATIFVARRTKPHDRGLMAKRLGATVHQVMPGYLAVAQARARAYAAQAGRRTRLLPFGLDVPEAEAVIGAAAKTLPAPDEFWCASGSGVLCRALRRAWPNARANAVQVGRTLTPADVLDAKIHISPYAFGQPLGALRTHFGTIPNTPFPSDPHYDAKAWQIARAKRGPGVVYFWNVTGPAEP